LRPGGRWFFTVNLLERRGNDLLVRCINLLRACVKAAEQAALYGSPAAQRSRWPFAIGAGLFCRNICTGYGRCRRVTLTFRRARRRIKTDFSRSPATNATFAGGGAPDAERFDKLR